MYPWQHFQQQKPKKKKKKNPANYSSIARLWRKGQLKTENDTKGIFLDDLKLDLNLNVSGFPGGTVVENLPANAGYTGSSPGLGGSHMPRSDWAREPQLLGLRVWSLCSARRDDNSERPAHRDEEWPLLAATGESPRTETKTQHSH